MLDSNGRVVGVNTAIISPSGSNAGIGFAIPIDIVNRVVLALCREHQSTSSARGWIISTNLKVVLSAVALAAFVAAPAVAKSRTQHHHDQAPVSTGIYQSYSLGQQSYPNPDRGPYPTPVPAWVNG